MSNCGGCAAELLARVLAKEGHAADDDHGNERDHERVLHGSRATLLNGFFTVGDIVLQLDDKFKDHCWGLLPKLLVPAHRPAMNESLALWRKFIILR